MTSQRFKEVMKAQQTMNAQKASLKTEKPIEKRVKKENLLSVADRLANEEIMKSVNHKLNYLRNPKVNTF
jgi:hypothetical protein